MGYYIIGSDLTEVTFVDEGTTVVLEDTGDTLKITTVGSYDSNGIQFKTSGGTNTLFLKEDGNVGIGTAAPTALLHTVDGSVKFEHSSSNLLVDFESSDSAILKFVNSGAGESTTFRTNRYFKFDTGDTMNSALVISAAGNVGIGTTSPSASLHTVDGAIKFEDSSNLLVDFESGDSTILKFVNSGVSESTSLRTNRSFKFDTGDTVNNALVISAAGNIDIAGDLTVKGHDIKAQDGTLCMTLNDATGDRAGYVDFAASIRLSEDGYIGTPYDAILIKLNGQSNQCEITGNLVVGDGTATDQLIALNGNAQDFRVGIDDDTDTMEIGQGVVMGTNTAISINSSGQVAAFTVPAAAIAQASDHIIFLDGGATGAPKAESVGDFLTAIAGAGLSVSSSQLTAAGGGDTAEMVVQSDAGSSVGSPLAPGADTVVILCVTSIAARYIQLPAAATATADRRYYIKDKAGNASNFNITILSDGSEEIDGSSANLVISTNYASVHLITDGSNWYII